MKPFTSNLLFLAATLGVHAQLITTRDTFEDGTVAGWHVGDPTSPAQPANIATDGPAGAGDHYL